MSHKRSEQLDFVVWSVSQLKSLKITIQIDVSMVNEWYRELSTMDFSAICH